MLFNSFVLLVVSWVIGFSGLAAGSPSFGNELQHRRAPRGVLPLAPLVKRETVFKNSTTLDKSWKDAVLFSIQTQAKNGGTTLSAGVEIVCTTCYIKGVATAQLTIGKSFNISQVFRNFTTQVETEIKNITDSAIDFIQNYTSTLVTDLVTGDFSALDDIDLPVLPFDFDIEVPDIPECQLLFQFDGLELYMQFDTTLSAGATYALNLYTSNTPIGVSAGKDNEIGMIFAIDLILSAEAQIEISSGFHIKLDDGVAINIAMFGNNVSSITLNGGQFEFLPVTISSANAVLSALLRVSIRAGVSVGSPEFSFTSGAEAGVYANIAEFITNVTAGTSDTDECEVFVEEVYSMAIGAQAGATLAIADHTWGPTPNTSTVLFYTTLASVCAGSVSALATGSANVTGTATKTASLTARAAAATGLTTTTLTTVLTYTGTSCIETGRLNCPASLQTTEKQTVTSTLVTSVASGVKATFPATTVTSVAETVEFGTNVRKMEATSGVPTSYTPPPVTSSTASAEPSSTTGLLGDINGVVNGKTGGVSNRVIIGVSVGVGVPFLTAFIAACFFFMKRRKVQRENEKFYAANEISVNSQEYVPPSQTRIKKSTQVTVTETGVR